MKPFMDADFLLQTETARTLYHQYAAKLPILDYHCHLDPKAIAEDKRFADVTELWLGGDHYKWRLMRAAGTPEREITGALRSDPRTVFRRFAEALPRAVGNPVYHWSHLELRQYFDIQEPVCADNADAVYDRCNERLREPGMSVRGLLAQSRVEAVCTTDDPADDLRWHDQIHADPSFPVRVLPSFRPEQAMNVEKEGFGGYLERLGAAEGVSADSFPVLVDALKRRAAYFEARGCRASDHALECGLYEEAGPAELETIFQKGRAGQPVTPPEAAQFRTALLCALAEDYARYGWVMQLHFGCLRNTNTPMYRRLGPDTGFDCASGDSRPERLAALLDRMNRDGNLPRTILYSLSPNDNEILTSVAGCFNIDAPGPAWVQLGSAWWLNDHKRGMEKQLAAFAEGGLLGGFVGMLTDSRSFVSYPRHEYFRRILCNFLGNLAEDGEYPSETAALGGIAADISYDNALRYFRLGRPTV